MFRHAKTADAKNDFRGSKEQADKNQKPSGFGRLLNVLFSIVRQCTKLRLFLQQLLQRLHRFCCLQTT